jgi:signal transduction histidine kinase
MVKQDALEPGLLPVFRLFVSLQVIFFLLEGLHFLYQHQAPPHPLEAPQSLTVLGAILLVYLFWPGLERHLGAAYLPIALCYAFIMPFAAQVITLRYGTEVYISLAEELGVLLIFPLLLISWQYHFRVVVFLSLAAALVDRGLALWVAAHSSPVSTDYIGFLAIRTIMCLTMGYAVSRLMTAQREQRHALRQANAELAHYAATLEQLTVSRERNRVARELHDTLAHTLSGIAVQLEAVKALWESNPDEARTMLEQSLTASRSGLTETRRALLALRTTPLQDLGLVLSLRGLAESAAARAGLALDLHLPEHLELPPDVEQGLYRVAQETLENVVKHAQAKQVSVRLAREGGRLTLCVTDDGCGFEVTRADNEQHYGLRGMFERANIMGGKLQVESQPGRGTTIRLAVEEGRGPRAHL